jgi:two-component system, OmpR family, sensor histidine kinase KdpD
MTNREGVAAERLLVCVGPSPANADVIRAAQGMAAGLKAAWFAVYVEDPKMLRLPEAERLRAVYNLRLAEQLGAESITLRGRHIAEEIVNFARQRQITRIVTGKPTSSRWKRIFLESPVDELMRQSGGIDIYAITGEPAEQKEAPVLVQPRLMRLSGYEMALIYFIIATGFAFLMYPYFDLPNLIMVYLVAVMVTALYCGRGPAILNSILCVLTFDFCFVPPRWSFNVEEAKYLVTFAVMFLTALVISHLAALIRRQAEASRLQERQTATMYALNRQLSGTRGIENILQVAVNYLFNIFQCQAVALLPNEEGKLQMAAGDLSSVFQKDIVKELGIAQGVHQSGQMAGWGTQNMPESPILYIPLQAANATLGVLALRPRDLEAEQWLLPEQFRLRLLESLTKQIAMALEVERLQKTAMEAQVAVETERLRSSLLGSMTHDFQTPLAAIMGSASSLG